MTVYDAALSADSGPLAGNSAAPARPEATSPDDLSRALREIAASAPARDQPGNREFPTDAFAALRRCGALSFNARPGSSRPFARTELELVRRVSAADGSVGRIFDGHLNAVERLAVQAPEAVRESELAAVRDGTLLTGVWGGDPVAGSGEAESEGTPATIIQTAAGEALDGVKTFCSGAGGIQRAIVVVRGAAGEPPLAVWVDVSDPSTAEIDFSWYRAHGLAASASHRVIFHEAPVIARIGGPGAITAQPWFGRDALRTAASWAGMADTACAAALACLSHRPARTDLDALSAARIRTAQMTIDVWLEHAATAMDRGAGGRDLGPTALHARAAIASACRTLLDEASRGCGSHPVARAQALDRAKRDLDLFLLQHRLEPLLARHGAMLLNDAAAEPSSDGSAA